MFHFATELCLPQIQKNICSLWLQFLRAEVINLFLHTHLVIYNVLHAYYGNASLFAKRKNSVH